MNNILVTGVNGQVGSELRELKLSYPQYHFLFTDRDALDITDKKAIFLFIQENKIKTIINCAAYTAVDKAESEPKLANKINYLALENLAKAAKIYDCKFVHISTDYVFDGKTFEPYIETDKTNPHSIYGSTKLAGELILQKINPKNSIIIRTSWVYSTFGNNFVKTMLKLGKSRDALNVIDDQFGTPTYAGDLAKVILDILPKIKNDDVGVFHYSNEGICSWYEFAIAIFKFSNINCKVKSITTEEYPTAAKRPKYSTLNKSKIKETFLIEIPHWKHSLEKCIKIMSF